MNSFYGGQQGKSFEIKKVYSSYYEMIEQLPEDNSILPGEFIMISYGQVGTEEYETNKDKDKENGFYGSTLWVVNEDKAAKMLTSTAGEAATLTINIGEDSGLTATPSSGPQWSLEGTSINRILNLSLPGTWNIEATAKSVTSENEAKVEKLDTNDTTKTFVFDIPRGTGISDITLDPPSSFNAESEGINKYTLKVSFDNGDTQSVEFSIANGKAGVDGVTITEFKTITKTDSSTGKTIEGYQLVFSDGKAFDIYNGAEGPAGSADTLITNEYSEADKIAYSTNYINNNFWNYSQNIIKAPKYENYIKFISTIDLPKQDWAHFCGWFLVSSYPEVVDNENADNAILGLLCLEFGSNGKYGILEQYGLRGYQGMRWLALSDSIHEKDFIAKMYKTEEWSEGNTPISIDIYNTTNSSIQIIYLGKHEELKMINSSIIYEEYEAKYTDDNLIATYTSVFDTASSYKPEETFEAL